ncbi:MAG: hypothetical protein QOE79_1585 [Sphingomonadales bacterium]|jgi:uncharacterized protein (DUF2147 family)|nr:hypothetical protein [Sphingomonadales bacterium]
MKAVLASLALALLGCANAAAAASAPDLKGVWVNPKGSIAVRTEACGGRLCGYVVWLNAKATADAKESGVANPIGAEVLRDYRPGADGAWHGIVYVLDMGRSFRSTLTEVDPNDLRISGCLLGNFLCRSQTWHRR